MSLGAYHQDDKDIIKEITEAIYKLIIKLGVPTNFDETWELVTELLPIIQAGRTRHYNRSVEFIHQSAKAAGVIVTPAKQRKYYPNAAWKMLARALGWNPKKNPIEGKITDYDPAYQQQLAEKVIPFPTNPNDPITIYQVARRVAAGAARHVRAAGRDVVVDTADLNQVKDAKPAGEIIVELDTEAEAIAARNESKDPGKVTKDKYIRPRGGGAGGVELGWARVLTGAENCVFCAMLASRGPVYTELTVLTAGDSDKRQGLSYHDYCDCKAVLVVKGRPWEGEEEFKALQETWNNARDFPTMDELDRGLKSTLSRFRERYAEAVREDPEQFVTFKPEPEDDVPVAPRPDAGYPDEDGGAGLAGSVFEQPGPDGRFVLPETEGLPEVTLQPLYGVPLAEYPRLETPETMEQAAVQTARVHSFANCVRATAAAVMRMKGYDIHPYATLYSSSGGGLQIFEALKMWETHDGPVAPIETTDDGWKAVMGGMPDGSYGILSFEIARAHQRHVILWKKKADETIFIDPQSGQVAIDVETVFGIEHSTPLIVARLDEAHPVESKAADVILPFTSQEV